MQFSELSQVAADPDATVVAIMPDGLPLKVTGVKVETHPRESVGGQTVWLDVEEL